MTLKKEKLSQLKEEISQLEKQMVAELYSDESEEINGEIIPVSLPTKPTGTIANPQLKAAQELNTAIKTSVSKQFKVIDGQRHEIMEEVIGPMPKGGFVAMGLEGDKYD